MNTDPPRWLWLIAALVCYASLGLYTWEDHHNHPDPLVLGFPLLMAGGMFLCQWLREPS